MNVRGLLALAVRPLAAIVRAAEGHYRPGPYHLPVTGGWRPGPVVIKIIAVLCSLSSPANCHEQTVTTSNFADVSMQSCLMGAPQLAEWMKQHPAERLAAWRCVLGKQDGRGA
jgi:hypothetical protein